MYNTEKITFRSLYGETKALYTPEFLHDVVAMRSHPDYEELAADGTVVVQPTDGLQRPLMSVDNVKTLAPSAPRQGAPKKTNLSARGKAR